MSEPRPSFLERWGAALVALGYSLATLDKPFHIDDPNFLYYARIARAHPLRPFDIGKSPSNPPGFSYLLGAITAAGEDERWVHLCLLPLTLLALHAAGRLARWHGVEKPWLVQLAIACSGCFLLSASSVMPDMALLACTTCALWALREDEARPRAWALLAASALFAIAWTFRFSGFPVLLLAAAVSLVRGHRRALVPLACALGTFALWSVVSRVQTGEVQTAAPAGLMVLGTWDIGWRTLSTAAALLLFTAIPLAAAFALPRTPRARLALLAGLGLLLSATVFRGQGPLLVLAGALLFALGLVRLPRFPPGVTLHSLAGDALLWGWAGLAVLVPLLYQQGAAKYLTLALPPLAILLARALEAAPLRRGAFVAGCTCALVLGLLAAVADYRLAREIKRVVVEQAAAARASTSGTAWIGGQQWGGFYYGPAYGLKWDWYPEGASHLKPGDQLLDVSYPGELKLPRGIAAVEAQGAYVDPYPVRVMGAGAGLWSTGWGLMPFAFSREPLQPWWRVRIARAP